MRKELAQPMDSLPLKRGDAVQKWRVFAARALDLLPPQFLVVLLLVGLYIAFDIPAADGFMAWIATRFGIPVIAWKLMTLVSIVRITYYRPSPRQTLLFSLPTAVLSCFSVGYAASIDPVLFVFVLFTYLSIGIAIVAMILYQEQLVANERLSEEIDHLRKAQVNDAAAATPPNN